jgi:hypothetical protein
MTDLSGLDPIDFYFGRPAAEARAMLPSIDHFGYRLYGPLGDCAHCGKPVFDGALVSGWTKAGPDFCAADGDFGCWESPDTGKDGSGGHALAVTR